MNKKGRNWALDVGEDDPMDVDDTTKKVNKKNIEKIVAIMRIVINAEDNEVAVACREIATLLVEEFGYSVKFIKRKFYQKDEKTFNAIGFAYALGQQFRSLDQTKRQKNPMFDHAAVHFLLCSAFIQYFNTGLKVTVKPNLKLEEDPESLAGTPRRMKQWHVKRAISPNSN